MNMFINQKQQTIRAGKQIYTKREEHKLPIIRINVDMYM